MARRTHRGTSTTKSLSKWSSLNDLDGGEGGRKRDGRGIAFARAATLLIS